jgi:hypothetical protein
MLPLSAVCISCVCLLFSLPALFVFGGMASSILIMAQKRVDFFNFITNNKYKIVFIIIFVCIYLLYIWNIRNPDMFSWWEKYFKYSSIKIFNYSFMISKEIYTNFFIVASSFLCGLVLLYKNNIKLFLLVLMTGIFFLSAFLMKIYPFGYGGLSGMRLSLFYFPLIFISISYSFYEMYNFIYNKISDKLKYRIAFIFIIFLFYMIISSIIRVKNGSVEQTANLIKKINIEYNEQCEIIIYSSSVNAYKYYQHRNKKKLTYLTIDREQEPIAELQRVIEIGRRDNKNTFFILFSHYRQQYFEKCLEFVRHMYSLEALFESPGARLIIFRVSGENP